MAPYADTIRQREYQRNWARRTSIYKRKDGELKISASVVTWEMLQDINHFDELTKYEQCTELSKKYITGNRTNRLAVAALAIQACKIKQGGDVKSKKFIEGVYGKTLRQFSVDIKMHYKTLHGWVAAKTLVIDRLPKSEQMIDWTAADNAVRRGKRDPKEIIENYFKFKDGNYRTSANVIRYLSHVLGSLEKMGTTGMSHEQKIQLKELINRLSRWG